MRLTHRAGGPGSADQHNSAVFDQAKGIESRRGHQIFFCSCGEGHPHPPGPLSATLPTRNQSQQGKRLGQLYVAGLDRKSQRFLKESEKVNAEQDLVAPSLVSEPKRILVQATSIGWVVPSEKVKSIVPVAMRPMSAATAWGIWANAVKPVSMTPS